MCIYPNSDRQSVRKFFDGADEGESDLLIVQMTFIKSFPFRQGSQFDKFAENQRRDRPFWLQPFLLHPDGRIELLFSIQPILKFDWKIKHRRDLEKGEVESWTRRSSGQQSLSNFLMAEVSSAECGPGF